MAIAGGNRRFRKNRQEFYCQSGNTGPPESGASTNAIDLAGRLLRVQDEERRSMARGLHDTVLQDLAGALMIVDRLGASGSRPATHDRIDELGALIGRSVDALKRFSNLLYPPLLDEVGLPSALKSLIREFEERTGIRVRLRVQRYNAGLRDRKTEHALFRMVQEMLLNVEPDCSDATAEVRLEQDLQETTIEIEGLPLADIADSSSLGLHMVRARLQQVGGRLEINSTALAATISATVPSGTRRDRVSPLRIARARDASVGLSRATTDIQATLALRP